MTGHQDVEAVGKDLIEDGTLRDPFGSGPSGLPGHRVRISRSGRNWRVATLAAQGKQALQDNPLYGQ